jgi:hypothetical protein
MPHALKSYIQVTAGVLPGIGIAEYTKRWEWAPEEVKRPVPLVSRGMLTMTPQELLKFHENIAAAHRYAIEISNPGFVNWVNVEWVWL